MRSPSMNRVALAVCLGATALLGMPGQGQAQQKTIIHNPNNYPVWVATGNWREGVMDLTGGGNHALDEVHSKGWVKIPPRDAYAFAEYPSHLYVRAYSLTTKVWFQVRPTGPGKPVKFFNKLGDFKEGFYVSSSLTANVQAKGGELKEYYPLAAYLNPTTKRYEVTGPQVQGGEPPAPLPPAVAMASFTNRTNSRVFFTVSAGGKAQESSLAAGQTVRIPIQLGNPPATVTITQNDGKKLSFSLPKGGEYEFKMDGREIRNFFRE